MNHRRVAAVRRPALVLAAMLALCAPAHAVEVVGWTERVTIHPGNVAINAKLDTGAQNSSLHCDCISPFERDGAKWAGFTVESVNGEKIRLERKVVRSARIKRAGGEPQDRMVIRLGICLGHTYREAEVTLVDRAGMNFPMLIGRSFLEGKFAVDSSATFTTEPDCKNIKGGE